MLPKSDRVITVVDKGEEILVIDARSGKQKRHRVKKNDAKNIIVITKDDCIKVLVETLEYEVAPLPQVAPRKKQRSKNPIPTYACRYLGEKLEESFPPQEGAGDHLADILTSIGITKERWSSLITLGKEEGICTGCNGRQNFVNWLASKLGMPEGQGAILHKALELEAVPEQPMFNCELFGRCISGINGSKNLVEAISNSGIGICKTCTSKEYVYK